MNRDEFYMKQALGLARRGGDRVRPNPKVGAVLVKGGKVVAAGYHSRYGGPHAEARVLSRAGSRARGATLYVTLEPCSTFGKTPPCTAAILAHGVRRVVVGAVDANPRHRGRGLNLLRRSGVEVVTGVCREECSLLNRDFSVWIAQERPYGMLKLALSLDGKIATKTGNSKWISSAASRRIVHRLRSSADAVMVGIGTVDADDPSLSARMGYANPGLKKVVIDPGARLSPRARLFARSAGVVVAVGSGAPAARVKRLEKAGAVVVVLPGTGSELDLRMLGKYLFREKIVRLLVEGGGITAARCLEQGLLDEVHFFFAPILVGGRGAVSSLAGTGAATIADAVSVSRLELSRPGGDIYVRGLLEPGKRRKG
ncbi:MAG TPA: bifunctional diaminohydroxyphosphoribosylaminopyrimidine deaminase/5-amino-6-(5-phosphoribosylamino)uracil reductase RibD [bacterium]|nr:bifunctional diaminohydroxyphosphoribosylaminopyrimidine deaminase/5-amino-6-(5-phosphoribosylamino)uracil reductase RibD [bacterium]HPJ71142.1 bifunctional diaminohydroxyphosphoribosylaminopyrimidine deaminase/5-amino-6-(5-phosphoribosylamino)uracil reductase RibD [bacterium]